MNGTAYHPDLGQLMTWNAAQLSTDPDTQVEQTIRQMRRHVLEDVRSAPIQRDAAAIQSLGGDPLSDTFWWVKNRVGFRQDEELAIPALAYLDDPNVVEFMIRPRNLANLGRPLGDCDDFASLTAALLLAQGIPTKFVTAAADDREPGRFSHVYVAAYPEGPDGARVSLDTSHGAYPGWECTESGQVTRLKEWTITGGPDWGELLLIAGALFALACLWRMV